MERATSTDNGGGRREHRVSNDVQRLPGLDGLRGVAILIVFVHHAVRRLPSTDGHEALIQEIVNAGWIGVDLFFVLSGFLISGILLDAKWRPGYFRTFYARRALRILPLYVVFVATIVWVAPALALTTPDEAHRIREAQAWYWAHAVNLKIALSGWTTSSWHSGHLWSLSLEEQFYLVWPAVVYAASRRGFIRTTIVLVIAVSILRALLVALEVPWTAIYVLLPTRMDSLAMGALLAGLAREPKAWRRAQACAAPAAACAVAALGLVFWRESLLRPGTLTQIAGYPALALCAAALVVSAAGAPEGSRAARLWGHPALRWFGRYSYGLYVWHAVVIALLHQELFAESRFVMIGGSHLPGYVLFTAVALGASMLVTLVSWYLVEAPFLALKRFVPYASGQVRAPYRVPHFARALRRIALSLAGVSQVLTLRRKSGIS